MRKDVDEQQITRFITDHFYELLVAGYDLNSAMESVRILCNRYDADFDQMMRLAVTKADRRFDDELAARGSTEAQRT